MVLAISTLYFITTGIQYWVSDYLQVVLGAPADEVFYFYSFTCLSAPFCGLLAGGVVFSNIGGYNSPKAFPLLFLLGMLAIAVSLPAPFIANKNVMYGLMWLLFFSGAFLLPTMTGIMLNSVQEGHRTTANSVATLVYNLLGYLPAPFVYGFVSTMGQDAVLSSRYAMGCIMFMTLLTAVMMMLGYREKRRLEKEEEKSFHMDCAQD